MKFMHIVTILILALSSNLDNLGVGVAYGTRKTKVSLSSNLLIAAITSACTLISMAVGKDVALIAKNQRATGEAGAAIIIVVGIYLVFQSLRATGIQAAPPEPRAINPIGKPCDGLFTWLKQLMLLTRDPSLVDRNYSRSIETAEAATLGVALSLNNVPNGLAAGLIGLSPAMTTIAVFVFSVLTLCFGIRIGVHFMSRVFRNWAGPAAGIMLIVLGVYELFG
jgi:putative sporulation protein YtaF